MRSSTGSPIFSDFKSDLSRVVRFPTAGQGERRPWVRGCVSTGIENEFYEVGFDYVQSFFSQN